MTRSPFTVLSALAVPCDKATGGCGAAIGKRCTAKSGLEMAHCHTSRRKAADAQRTREVVAAAQKCGQTDRQFFTPSAEPIPPEYYHNVPGRDGIFMIPSTDAPTYCNGCSRASGAGHDANCIYYAATQWTTGELAAHDAEKAIDETNWLAQSDAEIAAGIVPVDDGKDIDFDRPASAHNPETCRDPACECWPF